MEELVPCAAAGLSALLAERGAAVGRGGGGGQVWD